MVIYSLTSEDFKSSYHTLFLVVVDPKARRKGCGKFIM